MTFPCVQTQIRVWVSAACVIASLVGCGDSRTQTQASPQPDPPAANDLQVTDLTIDAANAPRGDVRLIAGEPVRIGVRIRGGTPPYSGKLLAVRQGRGPDDTGEVAPLKQNFSTEPNQSDAAGVELGMQATLDPTSRSGLFRLRATVVDARGQTATAVSSDWTNIGSDAPLVSVPDPTNASTDLAPTLSVVDVARRRRRAFVRGEQITILVNLFGQSRASIALYDAAGTLLVQLSDQKFSPDGTFALPIQIPRLARPGVYRVVVTPLTASKSTELTAAIEVSGEPFPPLARLTMDQLTFYGGADQRAHRAGRFKRGEAVTVEARVGGGRKAVTGTIRVHSIDGKILYQTEFGRADIAHPAPDSRVFVRGSWHVPETLAPGRYRLQVEATEEDHVSTRYREVFID